MNKYIAIAILFMTGCSGFMPRKPDGTTFRTVGYNGCPEGNAKTLKGECEATGYGPTEHYSLLNDEELSRQN